MPWGAVVDAAVDWVGEVDAYLGGVRRAWFLRGGEGGAYVDEAGFVGRGGWGGGGGHCGERPECGGDWVSLEAGMRGETREGAQSDAHREMSSNLDLSPV